MSEIQELFEEAAGIVREFCAAEAFDKSRDWDSDGGDIAITRRQDGDYDVLVWDVNCYDCPVGACDGFSGRTPEQALRFAIDGMREFIAEQKAIVDQLAEDAADD